MNIDYQIKFSKRKTITITVERDRSIIVKAPIDANPHRIDKIVESKKLWIYKKLNEEQKYDEVKKGKEFVSGETVLYLGKKYRLEIEKSNIEEIKFFNKFIVAAVSADRAASAFKNWYKQKAFSIIVPRVKKYAKNVGVNYNKIMVSELKYRWGSCTPKDNLNFNWRLIKAPMFVIDYVIVHELAHFIESNHTHKFWNIVEIQVPKYLKAKQWLKEHGSILETEF